MRHLVGAMFWDSCLGLSIAVFEQDCAGKYKSMISNMAYLRQCEMNLTLSAPEGRDNVVMTPVHRYTEEGLAVY